MPPGALVDADLAMPGSKDACDVAVTAPASPAAAPAAPTALPRCAPVDATATNRPCWRLAADPTGCPGGDHVRLAIEDLGELTDATRVTASCTVRATN